MNAERRRLQRLRRLEKMRAIAKQTAATEAAHAEGTLAQLRALSERTQRLAADYGARREAADGAALRQLSRFIRGLETLSRATEGDAARAESIADAKLRVLAEAERRRAATEERALVQERTLGKAADQPATGSRKPVGTALE